MSYKKLNSLLILVIGLLLLVAWQWPDQHLKLVFCDVGQGDAILISIGQTQMLVDGGPNDSVLYCLGKHMPFWDKKIELVVLSHADSDHLTGLLSVAENYEISRLVATEAVKNTNLFWQFRNQVIEKEIEVYEPKIGDRWRFSGSEIEVLWPKERFSNALAWSGADESQEQVLGDRAVEEVNKWSVVLKGSYGQFDWLLTGDIESAQEKQIMADTDLSRAEVLKVAHHGSKFSSDELFLDKVRPKLAVIMVGKNSFGHPTEEVLSRLKAVGAEILTTKEDGEIVVISDGKRWWVK